MQQFLYCSVIVLLVASCGPSASTKAENSFEDSTSVSSEYVAYNNPPAEGFDQEGSDLLATLLADKTMLAMGGREAWDNTRYLSWNFFGRRTHVWDKQTGDVRIESPGDELTILMNIHTKEGKVQKMGQEVTDSLDYYLQKGYGYWVNDAYWLVMPFKLKDSGVTLKYLEEGTTKAGTAADIVRLSFTDVGLTPQNFYDVWIDTDTKLVTQWAYYSDSTQQEPAIVSPWLDYKKYGNILLSANRGRSQLSDIAVSDQMPEETFTRF